MNSQNETDNLRCSGKRILIIVGTFIIFILIASIALLSSYPVSIFKYLRTKKKAEIEIQIQNVTKTSLSYKIINNTEYDSLQTGEEYLLLKKGLLGYKRFYDNDAFDGLAYIIEKKQKVDIEWSNSHGELKQGKYILVKKFSVLKYGVPTGKEYEVYGEFEVS